MIFISHRGNIEKIIKQEENNPEKILYCLSSGYNVEIDVWLIRDSFYLGHDEPQYLIEKEFLQNNSLWCHAKNLNALELMLQYDIHCFWHQEDQYTLTSKGIIWAFPNMPLNYKTIAVMPEKASYNLFDLKNCFGICSDNIKYYKENL